MKQMGQRDFWIGMVLLFCLALIINHKLYVMPDALSMTAGGIVGAYLFGWLVWLFVKWIKKERAPDRLSFIFVLACLSAGAAMLPRLASLSG